MRQKLEMLQKSLPKTSSDEPKENMEKQLPILKELLSKEEISDKERENLEDKLKGLKGQLPSRKRSFISLEEEPLGSSGKRFFMEGKYWIGNLEGSNKQVASFYNIATKEPVGGPIETSVNPVSAFILSAGYRHSGSRTSLIKFWNLDSSGSISRNATTTVGITGTEGSNYYYNANPWGSGTFLTKGVDRVTAESHVKITDLDLLHNIMIGRSEDKELGASLGLKYAQFDIEHSTIYSSTTSTLYNIKSTVQNTLVGPVFGIYGRGPIYNNLRFNGLLDFSITWDHVESTRYEYDNTRTQTALNVKDMSDIVLPVIDAELGMSYPLLQNLTLSLDYKAVYFANTPFELKPGDSTLLNALSLSKRDLLFHGLTAGLSFAF